MVLVYSENITSRVQYIFQFVLGSICGFDVTFTKDKQDYLNFDGVSFNYSANGIKDLEVNIKPASLLFETDIHPIDPAVTRQFDKVEVILNAQHQYFDPFAASFYLISRYEEYLRFKKDEHNRFEAASSILFKYDLLEIPLVDMWASDMKKQILNRFPNTQYRTNKFKAEITIDIDQATAIKHRGFKRSLFSLIKNLSSFHIDLATEQLKALFGHTDPFDSFLYTETTKKSSGLPFTFFVNLGSYSAFDKNLSKDNRYLKTLLQKLSRFSKVGIHPSYYSNELPIKFKEEKDVLKQIINRDVFASRQHYLKLHFPDTYNHLTAVGINEDYSMGYATYPGFRAGTCTPFNWFNLIENKEVDLKVYPITYMDVTLFEDLNLSTADAIKHIERLRNTVAQYNGNYLSVWHNNSLSGTLLRKEWKLVFEKDIEELQKLLS